MKTLIVLLALFSISNLGWAELKDISVNNKSSPICLGVGQTEAMPGVPGPKGWNLKPPCCSGLKDRESLSVCGKGHGGGYVYTCIACGDKKCDKKFESKCNCPEDCN